MVLIDEGHHNFHTLGGRYAPFARLVERDDKGALAELRRLPSGEERRSVVFVRELVPKAAVAWLTISK